MGKHPDGRSIAPRHSQHQIRASPGRHPGIRGIDPAGGGQTHLAQVGFEELGPRLLPLSSVIRSQSRDRRQTALELDHLLAIALHAGLYPPSQVHG